MNVATGIVWMLKAAGVTEVFGTAGESVLTLMDAVRADEAVQFTAVRHEQTAAMAADGFARTQRQPAACLAHVGAGSTNLVNGIADAYVDSVPVIAIAADVETAKRGRGAWHELDQEAIFEPITDRQVRLDHVDLIPQRLRDALTEVNTGSPGPILLTLPSDIAEINLGDGEAKAFAAAADAIPSFESDHDRIQPAETRVQEAVAAFLDAERPMLLTGGGVLWSGAAEHVRSIAEYAGVPVVTTLNGRGCLSERDPLCFGAIGTFGRTSARMVADDADFVLAVGTRLGDNETFGWSLYQDVTMVQVDIDERQLGRQYNVDLPVLADAGAFLERFEAILRQETADPPKTAWDFSTHREAIEHEIAAITDPERDDRQDPTPGRVNPREVGRVLSKVKAPADVITSGAGQHSLWANLVPIELPNTYGKSVSLGTMGFALGAGMGAQVASDDRTVFVVVGDGDFAMVCQEVWTCVEEAIPLVVIVFNDDQYSAIKRPQLRRFGEPPFGTDYDDVDFAAVARGFGATGIRVETGEDVEAAFEQAVQAEGPTVIDVKIDPDVQPPTFFYENQ